MLVLVVLLAKAISLYRAGARDIFNLFYAKFLFAPWLCVTSWEARQCDLTFVERRRILLRALIPVTGMLGCYHFIVPLYQGIPWWLQAYCAVMPFWLLLESIGAISRICWLGFGESVPAIHRQPWRARSLTEFWGQRWNRLIGDWLRQAVFWPNRRHARVAMGATFLVSGILHELVVSLPMSLVYGESVWGWLTCYFLIQYVGCLLEHRLSVGPFWQKMMLWLVVLLPVPLVLNRATLLIFHLGG